MGRFFQDRLEIDGIRCVPCAEFLAELRPLPGAKAPLRVHPELSRIEFRADAAAPLDPEDWPDADPRS